MNIVIVAKRDKWLYPGESIIVMKETADGKEREVMARFTMPDWNTPTKYLISKLEIEED